MVRYFNYGFGALIIIPISIGIAAIAYGGAFILFDFYNLPAWILGPLGVYTLISSLSHKRDFYSLAWGLVFLAITGISVLYKQVNSIIIIGILLIALGILSSIAYLKS